LIQAGQREKGLASLRRAAAILDESFFEGRYHTFDREPSPFIRNALASSLLAIAVEFTAARREEESAVQLKRIRAVLEAMVRDDPGSKPYRDTLLRTYRAGALAHVGLGDVAGS